MSNEFSKWCVSERLVRLVLFRVLPGRELEVGRLIEQRCAEAGMNPEHFRVFQLFGSYDLLFIQDGCQLTESDMVELGNFPGISGSTEYVCYKWQEQRPSRPSTFGMRKLSKPLVGLCFMKINPLLIQELGLSPELGLAHFILRSDESVQMLGTMGWSEVVLLISDTSLASILRRIGKTFPGLMFRQPEKHRCFAEKTLTILGHDLEVSDPAPSTTKKVLIEKELRNGDLEVHFSASCTPQAMAGIERYAQKKFALDPANEPRVTFRLGARDLDFSVPLTDIKTLGELVQRLDAFRRDNIDDLIRTHTELQYRTKSEWPNSVAPERRKRLLLTLERDEAQKLVGLGAEGEAVACAIYHFNNLLENRLLVDAFSDMMRAMARLKDETLKLNAPLTVAQRTRISTRLQYLQQAISQRYQGAYLGVEESPWGASFGIQPVGMGIHRVLKALELYASELLLRLGKKWSGFVLVGRHRLPTMEHSEDILLIPPNDALDAFKHWAMSHEIMHVLQHLEPDKFSIYSLSLPGEEPLSESDFPGKLILEAATDIMEFRLSCTLSVHDYLRAVWKYLEGGLFELTSRQQLGSYVIRSFAVLYVEEFGTTAVAEAHVRKAFDKFLKFLITLQVDLTPLQQVDERGQGYLDILFHEFIDEIQPYLPKLVERVDGLAKNVKVPALSKAAVARAVSNLKSGQIIAPGDMVRPDAVAWELIAHGGADSARVTITWLLSLWHYYQVNRRGPDLCQLQVLTPHPTARKM